LPGGRRRVSAGRRVTWPLVVYQRTAAVSSVSDLDLRNFIRDAVVRGVVSPSEYLITVEAGYEIRQASGDPGLSTTAFSVTPVTGTPAGAVTSAIAGKCLDDWQQNTSPGNKIDLYSCNGTAAQQWAVNVDGAIQISIGGVTRCMGLANGATSRGTDVALEDCSGSATQVWEPGDVGALWNEASGLCLADPQASTQNGTQLIIWTCDGGAEQDWTLPKN